MNPGDRYGRYEIVRMLGRGAMGEVYLALDHDVRRQVALKVVYRGPDPEDEEILKAELLGAELQSRLGGADPRVVAVNRYGYFSGNLFIDMEYVDGEDLSVILGRGPLPPRRAAEIAIALCEMLHNLGRFETEIENKPFVGVIHGDLKPRNVRINLLAQVKVMDFGIAKALSKTRMHTQNVFASTAYCSPERLDTQSIDTHSDLWSVGVMLYQMIAGRLPFDAQTKERLERRIRSGEPPEPLAASCPEPLRNVVAVMLARDPALRYQSAAEVAEDLKRFLRGEPLSTRPVISDATVRTTAPADSEATVRTTRPAEPQPVVTPAAAARSSRQRRLMGCFAVFTITALVVFIFTAMQVNVYSEAARLRTDLQAEHVKDLDAAWKQYQDLAKRAHVPLILWGARRALRAKLLAAAREPELEYRNDTGSVYENQWRNARVYLERALELDPDDKTALGLMRLCEGHIERIGARGSGRQKRLATAVVKFKEAAELLKREPDPYLGLARIYVYDLNDMDAAEQALRQADKYGHKMGNREKAQLADGYRRRADRIWRDSRAFITRPSQEKEYLLKARDDYTRAQQLYQEIGVWGDAAQNRMQAMLGEERVEQRIHDIDSPPPPPAIVPQTNP